MSKILLKKYQTSLSNGGTKASKTSCNTQTHAHDGMWEAGEQY